MMTPLFRHVGLKVLSIALASLTWLLVAGEQIVERALRVPLEFTNLPAELEIVGDAPDLVEIRIRGSSGALARIAAGELVAVLDLRTARSGPPRLFHLTNSDVRVPFGVDVVQVTPSTVSMTFEPSVSKMVPVVAQVEGEPAAGFVVGTVSADPGTVEIVGPATVVKSMTRAITEPVSVTDASGTVVETATVGTIDPLVRLREPRTARVTVNVVPAPVEWVVTDVAVRVHGMAHAQVTPASVRLHVRGPRNSMQVAADQFDVSVDIDGMRPGQYTIPVRVLPPTRIGVVRVEPAEVRVRIPEGRK